MKGKGEVDRIVGGFSCFIIFKLIPYAVPEDSNEGVGTIHIRTYKIPVQRYLSNLIQFHKQRYVKTIDVTANTYNDAEGETVVMIIKLL